MDLADIAFLDAMDVQASVEPVQVHLADMMRLAGLAGFGPGSAVHVELEGAGDPMLISRAGVLALIRLARQTG